MTARSRVETWSSNLAFYLSIAGAAVGLGTLWRFPHLAGHYGGGLFVLVFVVACLVIAVPLLVAEFMIGQRGGPNVPHAAGRVAAESGLSSRWAAIGWLGTIAIFLIMTYYSVIGGWVLAYVEAYASGAASALDQAGLTARFTALLADPWRLTFWHTAFMGATLAISAAGLHRGIEIGNKIMMPGLFGILLALAIYALDQGDASRALAFLTRMDFSLLSGELVLAAVGQAFFATGVGMAIMIAYGSHVGPGTSLPRSAAVVVTSIFLASVLSSLLIFPLVFGSGVDPAQGPQLAFIVMPSIFIGMPASALVGTLFFVLLAFAALTSSIAGLDPAGAWLIEKYGLKRGAAMAIVAGAAWALGLATVLSFNHWSDVHPLAAIERFRTSTIFDLIDYFASNILLPVGALLTSLLVGWRLERRTIAADFGERPAVRTALLVLLKYLCPIAIALVIFSGLAAAEELPEPAPVTVSLRFDDQPDPTGEYAQSLHDKAIELLRSSNFNSAAPKWEWNRDKLLEERRAAMAGKHLAIVFAAPQAIVTVGGPIVVKEITVGLNHEQYASSLHTVDNQGRVVGHAKYDGFIAIELLELVRACP